MVFSRGLSFDAGQLLTTSMTSAPKRANLHKTTTGTCLGRTRWDAPAGGVLEASELSWSWLAVGVKLSLCHCMMGKRPIQLIPRDLHSPALRWNGGHEPYRLDPDCQHSPPNTGNRASSGEKLPNVTHAPQGAAGARLEGLNWKKQTQRVKFRAEWSLRWPLPLTTHPRMGLCCIVVPQDVYGVAP